LQRLNFDSTGAKIAKQSGNPGRCTVSIFDYEIPGRFLVLIFAKKMEDERHER
jgi:hypothetical protein